MLGLALVRPLDVYKERIVAAQVALIDVVDRNHARGQQARRGSRRAAGAGDAALDSQIEPRVCQTVGGGKIEYSTAEMEKWRPGPCVQSVLRRNISGVSDLRRLPVREIDGGHTYRCTFA